ncbi:MAG: ketoacyl-ACP synthase III [Alphaproteobacteria bacterium]|nr:ketoacyl-ACP synthase III [Alphaproteobacteria bacterium]
MKCTRTEIIGCGHYLPAKVLTNDDLSKMVETNDEWISTRTGIRSRHIVAEGELTSDMALKAVNQAMANAGVTAEDLDVVVVATLTPDYTTPSVAARIAGKLGVKPGTPAFDLGAACSGFVYAMTMVDNMIRLGQVKTAAIIGVESLSKIVDWTDRNTCVLFGDGAGAVIVKAAEGEGTAKDTGVLATKIYADGTQFDNLATDGGISATRTAGFVHMNGKEVFKFAVGAMSEASHAVLEQAGVTTDEIDWLLPHQANIRIISSVGQKLNVPDEKVIVTVDHHGNTSAASIPLALSEQVNGGKIKKGDLVLIPAMGAGFTWGGLLIRL